MVKQSLFDLVAAEARITEIAPLPSNPNVIRVKVEGKVAVRLPASVTEALGLAVGRKWTAALARAVEEAMELAKARRAAMTLLGRRAMSRGELIERLQRRHAPAIAERVGDELERDHWIDDAAYARAVAEQLVARKAAARAMIVDALVKRRVKVELAREVALRVLGEVDAAEVATDLARRRLASMYGIPPQRAARRIAGLLARRGFDDETINEALRGTGLIE